MVRSTASGPRHDFAFVIWYRIRVGSRRLLSWVLVVLAPMTKPLPFTQASLARAIAGVQLAGLHVVGVKGDGTLLTSEKPLDITSLVPEIEQDAPASEWEDQ